MVAQRYRWDFIGLSTDEKPTASTSPKVTDGSTYYCSDTSKLYVWYKDQWYEKLALGENGTAGQANSTYGGNDITNLYTDEELANKVSSGDFSGLHIGDYITKKVKVGNNTEREEDFVVAGIDYFYGTGDTEMTNHHLVLIPKNGFYENMKMNDTNTTTGGYYGSQAHGIASTAYTAGTGGALTSIVADYTTFLESALGATDGTYVFTRNASNKWEYSGTEIGDKLTVYGITYSGTPVEGDTITLTYAKGYLEPYRQAIYTAFGDAHVLKHRAYLSTSTSAGAWHTSRVELMNETMVYGCKIQASHNHGDMGSPIQLPYFGMCPNERISHRGKGGSRYDAWLSSIASGSSFCIINYSGLASTYIASNALAVRPYFLFGK